MRAARMTDAFAMVDLLRQQHVRSRYFGDVDVDAPYARKLLAQMIQRHGHTNDGGTCVFVIETAEGGDPKVCAFVAGILDRVYHIGDRLTANDVFLVAGPSAPPLAMRRLLDAYLQWADSNPKVFEVNLSWTNVLPTGERMAAVYERLGFERSGEIYRRRVTARSETAA